jgi:hypothetical protein
MVNGIEVHFEYGGMSLICDDAALARLYEHICQEASVSEVLGQIPRASGVRFISVGLPAPAPRGSRLIELIPTILATCVSGVVFVVGCVTIVQLALRHLG